MPTIRFRLLIIAATLLLALPIALTSLSLAQQPAVKKTKNCDNENCKDGSCELCQKCKAGECEQDECKNAETEVAVVKKDSDSGKATTFTSTHRQTQIFTPKLNGKKAKLATFRLRPDGHLVACVSPNKQTKRNKRDKEKNEKAVEKDMTPLGFVQVYSPDLELVEEFGLPFLPTALDLDKSGNMFVAGKGRICKLARDGEILVSCDSPNMRGVDLDKLKEEIKEEMQLQQERLQKMYQTQIATLEEQIKKIEEIDEDDRSPRDETNLQSTKSQLKNFERVLKQQNDTAFNQQMIERRIQSKSKITAVAVSDEDVFVATSARSGSGYEVYRMTHNFEEPELVLKRLRGCCGQMDIHAMDGKVYVAENTKFQVGIYDRDGQKVSKFGQRLQKDNQGFGGCCNPMNVLCCPGGEILTAESSIGKIKKFDAEGNMIGYVGRARIGGGCKHVAFGFDEKLDRYYVQFEDNHQICILSPKSDESDVQSDPAIQAFTQRLTRGTWKLSTAVDEGDGDSQNSIEGIGLMLYVNDKGEVAVKDMIQGAPAAKQGWLQTDDVVLAVGDVGQDMTDVKDMEIRDVAKLIKGKTGELVRIRYRSAKTEKIRRVRMRRARMEFVDGNWVAQTNDNGMPSGLEQFTNINSFTFDADGTVNYELPSGIRLGSANAGKNKWLATNLDGDTLSLDIESGADIITYRLKIKFTSDNRAQISVTYDGIGVEGEFKTFELAQQDDAAHQQVDALEQHESESDSGDEE